MAEPDPNPYAVVPEGFPVTTGELDRWIEREADLLRARLEAGDDPASGSLRYVK